LKSRIEITTSEGDRSIDSGAGRREGRGPLKCSQVEREALAEVQVLLGGRPRWRDLLIDLHPLQNAWLPARPSSGGVGAGDEAGARSRCEGRASH
jgi:hypothetical protein